MASRDAPTAAVQTLRASHTRRRPCVVLNYKAVLRQFQGSSRAAPVPMDQARREPYGTWREPERSNLGHW
ncbi:hypothetical protein RRG08_047673 [Elysia crispata]|uniref:Uncharacterized protein n=1 Tax=Elysia crispata TaxID=231223 RepID=A0AAE1BCE9_9GAST|nr:hypothetical protein RRG08_047673 [Elysia crispata]